MKVSIHPSTLKGIINAPASKSSMQRALAAALLRNGTTVIRNPGHSNDDKAAIGIVKALGADVKTDKGELIVESRGIHPVAQEINCGESGLSIRMFTPIVALCDQEITINGTGSLVERPMDFFDKVLPQLGVSIKSNNGKLPMTIKGPLQPKNIEVDGSLSSQFLTGLLMAYGAASNPSAGRHRLAGGDAEGESSAFQRSAFTIKVNDLKSKPYIDLTLNVMKQFGSNVPGNKNYTEFIFHKDSSLIPSVEGSGASYTVEGDWSGGAFLLAAGAIAGPITVRGLDLTSTQADKAVMDALMAANAGVAVEAKGIRIHPAAMCGFAFDATDCPDLFPPLVALAAFCKGRTTIKGVSRLAHKESNRALTLKEEFGKMGMAIELDDDILVINGGGVVKGATVHSRHDHRIAMACAVAALKAEGATVIEGAQAVKKSYPDFYDDLKKLGADVVVPGFVL